LTSCLSKPQKLKNKIYTCQTNTILASRKHFPEKDHHIRQTIATYNGDLMGKSMPDIMAF